MTAPKILARCVGRIGVQTVEREGERYFVAIKNRTYASRHEVPIETARRYWRKLQA